LVVSLRAPAMALLAALLSALLPFGADRSVNPAFSAEPAQAFSANGARYTPIAFSALPGWAADDHAAALSVLARSCEAILAAQRPLRPARPGDATLKAACAEALRIHPAATALTARSFFETHFQPYQIEPDDGAGFVTGYYEPLLEASRTPSARFSVPLHGVPDDLAWRPNGSYPAGWPRLAGAPLEAARETRKGRFEPFATRAEIETAAPEAIAPVIAWLQDPVDAFFVHIQGSTRLALETGERIRIGFAAKNGHPYRSIGRAMREDGVIGGETATAEGMKTWLRANPDAARRYMHLNPSYVFFREIEGLDPALGPIGGQGVPLTTKRSLAIDAALYSYGLPFWIEASLPSDPADAKAREAFARLMIAQDTGVAIKGPARGDLFWGTGTVAGRVAGRFQHGARFTVLLPRAAPSAGAR